MNGELEDKTFRIESYLVTDVKSLKVKIFEAIGFHIESPGILPPDLDPKYPIIVETPKLPEACPLPQEGHEFVREYLVALNLILGKGAVDSIVSRARYEVWNTRGKNLFPEYLVYKGVLPPERKILILAH